MTNASLCKMLGQIVTDVDAYINLNKGTFRDISLDFESKLIDTGLGSMPLFSI